MLHLSKTAKRRLSPPVPYQHGMVAASIVAHILTADYATATDLIEIGTLPADATIVSATVFGEGFTAGTTARVSLLDGEAGDPDDDRALTADTLFTAAATTAAGDKATMAECLAIAPSNIHRGIGVKLSADEAAGAKALTLVLEYTL